MPWDPTLPNAEDATNEGPPVLGTWRNVYAFVLLLHVLLIVAFYLFSRAYA